jgi:hypothetical protein
MSWVPRLPPSRQGRRWLNVLKTLGTYRLIDASGGCIGNCMTAVATAALLGEDFDLVQKDNLYRCLDKLLAHKTDLCSLLQQRRRPCSRPI